MERRAGTEPALYGRHTPRVCRPAGAANDADLQTAWTTLIAHTDDHFGREDEWMQNTGFSSSNCHSMQHKVILQVMREGEQQATLGRLDVVRQMAYELGIWFPQHAQSMDAALALHLRGVGYDAASGEVNMPQSLPRATIHGCGGSTCSDSDSELDADVDEQANVTTAYAPL
jgi:hemerythrin-like metal-binding protein